MTRSSTLIRRWFGPCLYWLFFLRLAISGLSRDARIYASSIATTPPPTASTVELTAYGLPEFSATQGFIVGDGNCQYRALSHLAYGDQQYHDYVRRYVTRELARNDHLYAGSSETDHTSFMYRQRDSGEWGVEQTLAAAAQVYQKKIIVLSLASDPFFVAYGSDHDVDSSVPGLLFRDDHYELLYSNNH